MSTQAPVPLSVLRGHDAPVNCVSFLSASSIISGAGDGVMKIWNLRTRRELTTNVSAHSRAGVLHVAALRAADGSRQKFVSQGRDGFVKLWDEETFNRRANPLAKFYCGSFSFTKFATLRWPSEDAGSSNLILSPTDVDNKLVIYDIRSDSSLPALTLTVPHTNEKRMCMSLSLFNSSVAKSENGAGGNVQTYIGAGFECGQFVIMDLRSGGKVACETTVTSGDEACKCCIGFKFYVCHLVISFDVTDNGRRAICGSSGESLYEGNFDVASYTLQSRAFFSCTHGGFSDICIRGDQRIVASAGWDHRVRIFHLRKLKPLAILKYHSESVHGLDFSDDSTILTSSSKDRRLAIWSVFSSSTSAARPY
ncbi:hypothetical protein PsorP6_002655 [Peronosclerospora sorghi]|uniref:Uncharacterized protein n=1 Tax=Peronosclerospora sorghi TaxID=230839 RepID=A0ACC0WSG2_9STRA|nr:hypothetical protein PsorP6_002655 [Peronosclerospora sorghi]